MEKWWKNSIIYQIYPRSFCDSNGDGIGDIPGIISKIPYLHSLGIDAIWLSPVYKSPDCDNGYDISDYRDINPDFGTMEDMDLLIKTAREAGIWIIMDLVINHTSDQHEWFRKAVQGDPKYRDYYIFQKGKNGKKPNNWGSFFGSDVWEKVPLEDDLYYLHLFDKRQPDLNWKNPEVYKEVCDIMRFWLDKGIKGFRCDVINVIYKNSLADGKKRLALTGLEHYLSTDGNHEILRGLRHDVLDEYDAFTVGETVMVDTKEAMKLSGSDRKELDTVFGFTHMECDQIGVKWFKTKYKPEKLIKALDTWQKEVEWPSVYFENHDQPRSISRFGDPKHFHKESAKMLAGLLLTLRGTCFIYEGEEIGMTNCDFAGMEEIEDVESHTIFNKMTELCFPEKLKWKLIKQTSRDNARTPMQWEGETKDGKKNPGAGFTTGTPWLKINKNYKWINVQDEERDNGSILEFYKQMIGIRHHEKALTFGGYRKVDSAPGIYVFNRGEGDDKLTVICNMTEHEHDMPHIAGINNKETLICNYDDKAEKLRPYEFMILK